MDVITTKGLTVEKNNFKILDNLNFNFKKGKFYSIIGPNGSGKTTLIKSLGGLIKPKKGEVLVYNENIHLMDAKKRAGIIAILPQNIHIDTNFTVKEIVEMGRYYKNPYIFQKLTKEDRDIVKWAMEQVKVEDLANRQYNPLSGGEKQRVLLARALSQKAEIFLLDEPTASLDINYQLEILKLLEEINKNFCITIIAVLHDLQLAAKFSDEILLMNNGRIYKHGIPREVITKDTIKEVFKITSNIYWDSFTNDFTIKAVDLLSIDNKLKIHVIAGGGSGVHILELFGGNSNNLSLGVVNREDLDWKKGKELGIKVVEIPPYSGIDLSSHQENLRLIDEANLVILCNTPFGHGNIRNLEGVQYAVNQGKKIIIIGDKNFQHRDFTENKVALEIFNDIIKGQRVFFARNVNELRKYLEEEL
ncbi:iron complex transport system ATP-binding protein [Anaerobranca californiensis DSM 14826]|jgi:iron complex transport system ATP-binding protein|uniref:Iron complex transport system ATP-binding protein n=1 Tax=Anaerobranca californiensis DSM 14826 TaxID=1120989 RepID=A0A1M6N6Q7_9FIRM|nr:ABC transporter ATP-binding protein [Anaerobranca californiensis]SHJ91236.1 iron complex transport system ATP-binding protein [Anaerobranca californiensis DSM 14826]